jgi:hypothetical protein
MIHAKWDRRIRRANELATTHPFAAEGLRFYERLARFQKSLYFEIEAACGRSKVPRTPGALRREFDSFLLLPRFAPFLSLVVQIAPPPLAQSARELVAQSGVHWEEILVSFWDASLGSPVNLDPGQPCCHGSSCNRTPNILRITRSGRRRTARLPSVRSAAASRR